MGRMILIYFIFIIWLLLVSGAFLAARKSASGLSGISLLYIVLLPGIGCLVWLLIRLKMGKGDQEDKESADISTPVGTEADHGLIEAFETVPMEDALFLNNVEIRKKMMMDVIYEEPEEYLDVLNLAKMNDDTEVVHFASSALMEIYQEKEKELNELKQKFEANRSDLETLSILMSKIQENLEQGFLYGALKNYWSDYAISLLQEKLRLAKNIEDYNHLVHLLISQKHMGTALKFLNDMNERWENNELTLSCRMDYWIAEGNQPELNKVLADICTLKENKKFISKELENDLNFWSFHAPSEIKENVSGEY